MKKKLLDLLAKKRGIVDRMKQADAANNQTVFESILAENTAVDAEIARVKAIMEAEENVPAEPEGVPTSGTDPPAAEPVNSRECVHAFAECIRAQARGQRAAFETNADVLRRAMAVENAGAMTEGVEADGGLLVPQDIQTRINELRRSLVPLSDLFAVENVSFLSGSRVVDTAPNKGFTKIDEMAEIPQDDKPAFRKIAYKVEDYALILPLRERVRNEILNWIRRDEKDLTIPLSYTLLSNAALMVEAGLGCAFCLDGALAIHSSPHLRFVPIRPEHTTRSVLVWKKNRLFSPAASLFIQEINMLRASME